MASYRWRDGFPTKVDPDVFASVVDKIEATKGRHVRPSDIVEEATRPNSPIAATVEHSDEKAAHAHRLQQARMHLNALQIVRVEIEHGPNIAEKALFRVTSPDSPDRKSGYAPRAQIMGDREMRVQVIRSATKELQAFLGKFRDVTGMGAFVPRLAAVITDMQNEVDMLSAAASARPVPSPAVAPRTRANIDQQVTE